MKKYVAFLFAAFLCSGFFSFTAKWGGDVLEIYLNGRQVHQQFVQVDRTAKTLHLTSMNDNDRIEVFYSHCGYAGKSRVLTFKNEKNEVIREMKFPDAANSHSLMQFYRKDILPSKSGNLKLYYSSKELPEGRLLALIHWSESKARTASL